MFIALSFTRAAGAGWRRGIARAAWCAPCVLAALSVLAADAPAGPSVSALLAACERGLAHGDTGVDSALCEWYAVPCDCKLTRPEAVAETWCMPASESIDDAMRAVIVELRRAPDGSLPAESVVPGILERLYPCP